MPLAFWLIFLLMLVLVLLSVVAGLKLWEVQRKKRVQGMLKTVSGQAPELKVKTIVNEPDRAESLEALISRWPVTRKIEAAIKQAGLDWSPVQFFAWTTALALAGAVIGSRIRLFPVIGSVACAALLAMLPYWYVLRKRAKRMGEFEKQFPEALDFLARAMRSGHAFTASLEMLANESPAPLGPEFRRLYDEQNLGGPIDVALKNLAVRVPLLDVRFFVSAVMLQKDTGGNLAEILRNLSRVIRERFQLKGHVKAVSAHGRITAAVLTALPIVTALGLMLLAPQYLKELADDSMGRYLIVGAILLLFTGYYIMKRIIDIKV